MTDGDGQGIARIFGFNRRSELQQGSHHALHLMLLRAPVTHHTALHFERRILGQRYASLGHRQQRHPAYVRKLQRGFDIHRIEHFFNGDRIGHHFANLFAQPQCNLQKPQLERLPRRSDDGAIGQQPVRPAIAFDGAVTGPLTTAVDAEYLHSLTIIPPLGEGFDVLLIHVEIGVDALHIFVLFDQFVHAQHAGRVFAFESEKVLRDHGYFSGFHRNSGLL